MNPLRLLTKGHTFEGLTDRRCAYKLSPGRALPNFAAPKAQTFAPEPPAEPLQKALFEPPRPRPAVKATLPAKALGANPSAPQALTAPSKERPVTRSVWPRAAQWWEKLFAWRPVPVKPAATVQTELALEKVTVVRNDLSEDDLVVVTVGKRAGASTEKAGAVSAVEKAMSGARVHP